MSGLGTKIPDAVLCSQKEMKMDGRQREREREEAKEGEAVSCTKH